MSVIKFLFGFLSTKIKEPNYKKARRKAGELLIKKYKIGRKKRILNTSETFDNRLRKQFLNQ